jgi:putative inorganic carbon (hco3(-)) transporter
MAFWRTNTLHRQLEWATSLGSGLLSPRLASPARRASLVQWTVVGVVSTVLGVFAIGAASLPSRLMPLAVLAAFCPFVVAIIGNARRFFLALMILDIPFVLDINLDYRLDVVKYGAIAGLNFSVTTICLVVLYALWLAELLAKAQTPARPVLRPSLPLALFVAVTALSLTVARDVELSLYLIVLAVQTFLLFVYIVGTVRTEQDVLFIVTMLLVGLFLEGALMIGLQFLGHGAAGILDFIGARSGGAAEWGWRNSGTLGSPNSAAGYLSLLLGPAIGLLLVKGAQVGPWHRRLAALALPIGGLALLLTGSRGGLVALAVSGAIICLVAWRRRWLPKMAPFAVAIVLLGALMAVPVVLAVPLPFQDVLSDRLQVGDNGREPLVELAWRMIRDSPLRGVGANNFAVMIKDYATPEYDNQWLFIVHNIYLDIWAETGIGGLIAYLWFLGATIFQGLRGMSAGGGQLNNSLLQPLILGFTAGIIGQAIHMSVDVFIGRSQMQLLWLVAGLVIAMSSMVRSEANALDTHRTDSTAKNLEKSSGPNRNVFTVN